MNFTRNFPKKREDQIYVYSGDDEFAKRQRTPREEVSLRGPFPREKLKEAKKKQWKAGGG